MILDLGLVDYWNAYRIQREFVLKRRLKEVSDSIIVVEHPVVFTVGRSGSMDNLLVDREELRECGIEVLKVDRGGDITFHGPGQLVAYPITDLKEKKRDLHLYMRNLEEAAIESLRAYGIEASRSQGRTGVWVNGDKICSIGIAASDWITYHGLSMNVNVDLRYYSMIRVCGYDDVMATSLEKLLKRRLDMDEVKRHLLRGLIKALDLKETKLEEGPILA